MRAPRYKSNGRFGFNMTPMIDVVFLLIIFFLVSSHLARHESQVDLELATAASADDDIDMETPRVVVNVKADGSLWMSGRPIAANRMAETLKTTLENEGDEIEVRIRASKSVAWSNVEPIMLACTKAGIWNVTYAVYRESP